MDLSIDQISIAPGRSRKDMGDIDSLAASIQDVGLLHPVVVTPENVLIAGERRLLAVKQLGWTTVPVTVVDSIPDALYDKLVLNVLSN